MTEMIPSPEQQAVIEFPLEPLRVVAGAGTGKTTTMALRLRHLVATAGVEAEQALGITFTNKAAEELADRLRRMMPSLAGEGREVEVTTYHGFAHGLLREFGPLVGVERGASVITPGYARQLLREALTESAPRLLDLTVPGRRVDELATLAAQLGDHLRDPDEVIGSAPGTGAEPWPERLEMMGALAVYESRKRRLGMVDYPDLIARAHQLVTQHPEIAARVRDRFRVVLLDEYQDTNPAQRELLRAVFADGFPVTAVGDPDQTIYEWRGASLENFQAFSDHFPTSDGHPAATRELAGNRRSGRAIIDLANLVRAQIGGPGGLSGRLEPLPGAPDATVTTAWFHSARDEAEWIAREVVRIHEEGDTRWRDIGILFRRHRQIAPIRDALERHGVPVEVAALGGLLDVPEVADLRAWLSILGRPEDSAALCRIVLGSRYRLGLADLAPLARWVEARSRPHRDDDAEAVGWALIEAIDSLETVVGLSREATGRLTSFRSTYHTLVEAAQSVSLVELCRIILGAIGAWQEVEALEEAARLSARLNLYRFLDLAEEWSPLEGAPSLEAFLDYLDLLVEDRANDELDTARVSGEDAVAMLTVHRSKGLEWPAVFLPAVCKDLFPGRSQGYPDPTRRPQYLPVELRLDAGFPAGEDVSQAVKQQHLDQEWRTAYVAVTRAKTDLTITGAFWYTEKRPRLPSALLDLAEGLAGASRGPHCPAPGPAPGDLRTDVGGDGPDPLFPSGWRTALAAAIADPSSPAAAAGDLGIGPAYDAAVDQLDLLLDDLPEPEPPPVDEAGFRTSVTGLVTYATCPQRFFWSEIDRLPRRPAPWLRRGIELHRRIEIHNRGSVAFEEVDEGFYDAPADHRDTGEIAGGFAAFTDSRYAVERPILVEAPFELAIEGHRLGGRIDAVYEPAASAWEVVDFKSGRRRDDPARIVQLEAYAIAAADAGLTIEPPEHTTVSFVFLGGGLEVVSHEVDDAWLAGARAHVAELLAAAAGGEYRPEPSAACESCDFARFCRIGSAWLEAHR